MAAVLPAQPEPMMMTLCMVKKRGGECAEGRIPIVTCDICRTRAQRSLGPWALLPGSRLALAAQQGETAEAGAEHRLGTGFGDAGDRAGEFVIATGGRGEVEVEAVVECGLDG